MKNIIISFKLDNHKQAYLRRIGIYDEPVITTNKENARRFSKHELERPIKLLTKKYEGRITDIKPLKDEEQ